MRLVQQTKKGVLLRLTEYLGDSIPLRDHKGVLCQEVELPFRDVMDWYPALEGYYIRYNRDTDQVVVQFDSEGVVDGTTVDITHQFDCVFDVHLGVLVDTPNSIFKAFSNFNHNVFLGGFKLPSEITTIQELNSEVRTLLQGSLYREEGQMYKLYQAHRKLLSNGSVKSCS